MKISPESLSFDALVDDQVIMTMELSSVMPLDARTVQITPSGHRFDYRVEQVSANQVQVSIAPMTWTAGVVDAEIAVVMPERLEPLSIPVKGTIHPWVTASPAVLSLGMLDSETSVSRRCIKLIVASKDRAIRITSVDAEQASGRLLICPTDTREQHELELEFDLAALLKRYRPGDIIREVVAIRTTHPKAEAIRVQVIAAVRKDATK